MKWIIPNIVFVITIGILTVWLTFLTTKGALTNNSFKGLFKKLTRRGRITAFVLILILTLLIGQEINNQNLSYNKDKTLINEQLKRDSLITVGINSGVDSVTNTLYDKLSIAFLKQNLKIDTLKNTVTDLSKSNKTINIINDKDPTILINSKSGDWSGIKFRNGRYYITIESHGAGSTNFNIECYLLIEFNDGTKKIEKPILFLPSAKIMTKMRGVLTTTTTDVKELYFYTKGNDGGKRRKLS
jgi:hypothetical protein